MSWHITMLLVNLGAFCALRMLFPHAPDRMQQAVIFIFGVAFLMMACVEGAALFRALPWWLLMYLDDVRRTASAIEHIAVLMYVFRLFIADQERRCLPSSYQRSRSSPA